MPDNPVLERNLLALSSYDPALSALVGAAEPSPEITFLQSKTNLPVPAQLINGIPIPLHSKFDPVREGEKYLSVYREAGYLVFLGFGGGYHITPFLSRSEVSNILIIDRDIRVFRSIIEHIDIRSIIIDPRVTFLIDMDAGQITDFILKHYFPVFAGNLKTISLGSRLNTEKTYFQEIVTGIKNIINPIADDYTVQARFGRKWFINTLFNLAVAEKSTISLKPAEKIIITGAGPSLETQVTRIKRMRREMFLLATDTSLPTLLSSGISPDCVISIDCQQISYLHFFAGLPPDIPLVLDLASPPILTRLGKNLFFFSSGHPFSQYLSQTWRSFPRIDTSGGNVSHAAFSLACELGARQVYLAGIDFSYPDGKSYSRDTYLYPYFHSFENRFFPCESLFFSFIAGDKTLSKEKTGRTFRYTTHQLLNYKEKMESAINDASPQVVQLDGKGLSLSIDHDKAKPEKPFLMKTLLAQGPVSTDWRSFLRDYSEKLKNLPPPFHPISKYLYHLSRSERQIWITQLPAATYLREYADLKESDNTELLNKTREWTLRVIRRILQ
ncbi:MAG: motility associated factor glycosyltransferase family protein [Spirochaetales bacterium]|nr:motility associated factor glycosyltransferase family protein [Spirochaetales bacterium]